jgi:hypothetical protein
MGLGGKVHRLVNQIMNNINTNVPMNRINAMKNEVTISNRLIRNFSRSAWRAATTDSTLSSESISEAVGSDREADDMR